MVTPPSENELVETAKAPPDVRIRLGDTDGNEPEVSDEPEPAEYRLLTITRTAGGRSLDEATFARDLGALGEQLVDLQTPAAWARQIEVWHHLPAEDDEEEGFAYPLFWGELTEQRVGIDRGEQVVVRAQVQPYHFGEPLRFYRAYDGGIGSSGVRDIHRDPVFNPLVDGKIVGNESGENADNVGEFFDENFSYLFIDPESSRTQTALDLLADSAVRWNLERAVRTIAFLCNEQETFIDRPTDVDFTALSLQAGEDVSVLEPLNLRLRRGQYLPAYLDAMLAPHGFSWYLTTDTVDDESTERWIRLFRLGSGPEKEVYLQRPGESLDLEKTNTLQLGMEVSVGELANKVYGHGSLKEYEITVELYRGWAESQDGFNADDLAKNDPDSSYSGATDAWRLWVGNESGDYCGLRSVVAEIPDTALDLNDLDIYVPMRRPLGPTLELDSDGKRLAPIVEWYNNDEEEWQRVPPEWGAQILTDQLGVRFTGNAPPADLVTEGNDARLRVTGTILADERLTYSNEPRGSSPNLRESALFLDLSDRFHYRHRQDTGDLASVLDGDADEADDTEDLTTYCDSIRDIEDSAVIRATLVLHGVLLEYEIGDLITRVDGREISFNRNSEDAETKRYLQVMGIQTDWQQQQTTLIVEPQG